MKRRDFITLIGGVTAWPWAARAQQAMPAMGFLHTQSPESFAFVLGGFHAGLKETGFVEGQNLAIEYRWARGQYERLPELAAELVRQRVAVIATGGGVVPARAATAATATIPIVFVTGGDPVKLGLVASLNRPGGNVTGVSPFISVLGAKRLELLRELVPSAGTIAVLFNPKSPEAETVALDAQAAARSIGQSLIVLTASAAEDIDRAFTAIVQQRAGALLVGTDPFFTTQLDRIIGLASRNSVPTIYDAREYVLAGGLMSYGTSIPDAYRQQAIYVGRILKGEKPSDLPVVQPTKFELILNLRTAKALGLTIPVTLQVAADEVVE
jgi:putative ABC transport system substrate-binding protein